ncbi:MAG: Flp pilus assembly protein CpaB [Planctomycetaceae bacterium]|nr:Flp pilus assembly protein CpaB [Planctomycetaceae bacterium]
MKRITPAFVTLLMLVVVGLLIGVYVVKNLWAEEEPTVVAESRLVPMPIADLAPGTLITEAHLGQAPVARDQMIPDTLTSNRVIVGRVVKETIKAARPIRSVSLYQPGERPPLKVATDMRAITVPMGSNGTVVDGLIQPREFVDVHLTPSSSDPRLKGGTTMTLFKGVKILAINSSTQAGNVDRGGNTVTLELTPEQSNIIILADKAGDLTMSFNPNGKGTGGVTISDADRATLEEILNLDPLEEPTPPFQTEQFRGSARGVNTYRDGRLIHNGLNFDDSERGRGGTLQNLPSDSAQPGPGIASPSKTKKPRA